MAPHLGPPVQLAYVVEDVRRAALGWARERGAGPFFVRDHVPVVGVSVHGRPGVFDHSSAYGQWGPLMIELLCVHEWGPAGPDLPPLPAPSLGLHHLAFVVPDLAEALAACERHGIPEVLAARTAGGVAFHFLDTRAELGHLIEVYEGSGRLRRFYDRVASAAVGWDGTDPVREG